MRRGRHNIGAGESGKPTSDAVARNVGQYKKSHPPVPEKEEERNGCVNCLFGIFASRELANRHSETNYVSSAICELLVYILFLTTISVAVFGSRSFNGYYFNNLINDLFVDAPFATGELNTYVTFRTSTDSNHFWKFAESVMIESIYSAQWKDVGERRVLRPNAAKKLNFENLHIGRPRLRQVRIRPSPCPVVHTLRRLSKHECYLAYAGNVVDNSSLIQMNENEKDAFIEQGILEDKDAGFYWGKYNSYGGGGSYILLGTTEDETVQLVNQLKIWQWISRATRVIFLDFIIYNPNINSFAVVKLVWEFHPAGGMKTSWLIHIEGLERYKTSYDFLIQGFELAFVAFTIYYTIQEIAELSKLGCKKYCKDIWTWMDLSILIFSYLCIGFSVYRYFIIQEAFALLLQDPNRFTIFDSLGFWESQNNNAQAICLFLAWVKIFKYVSFNKTLGQVTHTLGKCYNDMSGFFVIFFLIFFGFVQLGHLVFGNQLTDFKDILSSMFTLLRFTLGDFNFEELYSANRLLGPIFFFAYTLFVIFILVNMFLAIVNESYVEVLTEIDKEKRFSFSRCFRRGWLSVCGALRCRNRRRKRTSLHSSRNGRLSHYEIKDNLLTANFTELEVETFLARHELDEDHIWDEDDVHQILINLENESYAITPEKHKRYPQFDEHIKEQYPINTMITDEDIDELYERIEVLQRVIKNVERSVDRIATGIEYIDPEQ